MFLAVISSLLLSTAAMAADFEHSIDLKKLQFFWTVEGDSLRVRLVGKTTGWVAVGFNATSKMRNANIIIGYVKKGKVYISDEYGTSKTQHKSDKRLKGKANIEATSGTEKNGVTTLDFTIPLDSGDKYDGVIDSNAKTRVIVAMGKRDSFKLGHNFHATLDVQLGTGEYQRK